jgi:outer membrane immunogenic protein
MKWTRRAALSLSLAWFGAPALAQDWSGLYGGIHFGLGRGQDEVREVNGPRTFYPDTDGALGGVQIGWQRQFERVVAGGELELGYLGQEGSVTSSDANGTVTSRAELGAYGAVSARAGYLLTPSWLVFARAGITLAAIDAQTDQTCSGGGCTLTPSSAATRDHAWAYMFGGGVENALSERWRARLEYQYYDFRRELALPASGSGPGWNHELDLHAIKFGINYRF